MMNSRNLFALITGLLVALPATADTINFDDGVPGTALGGFYASRGVTFSNAQLDGFISPGESSVGAGGLKLIGLSSTYQPKVDSPITATFTSAVSSVAIQALNVGANGARLDAFDASGNLVGYSQYIGADTGSDTHPLLSVSGADITRIELYQPLSVATEGLLFDNLQFQTGVKDAPEPSSLLLAGLGLMAAGRWLRRRNPQP